MGITLWCVAAVLSMPLRREVCRDMLAASGACAAAAAVPARPAGAAALAASIASPRYGSGDAVTLERVEGSGTDGRSYALLRLPDGARAILACAAPSLSFDADRGPMPTSQRIELSVTMGCGSMRDPEAWEGLAHLAEHVTLGSSAGVALSSWVDDRDGSLNGFTSEELTTFHAEMDAPDTSQAEVAAEVAMLAGRFADLFDCWRASPLPADRAVVERELGRVDAELYGIRTSPSKPLMELGVYKARANPNSRWARLGRGSAATLPLAQLDAITAALDELRLRSYAPLSATIALCSPLPLPLAASILSDAFRNRGRTFRPAAGAGWRGPPPFGSGHVTPPLAVERPGRFPCLTIGWCIPTDDRVAAARAKPCAILGEALTAPHAGSAVEVLRGAGLAPLAIEVEPVLTARVVASADGWMLWQLSLVMQTGTERRDRKSVV